MTCSNCGSQTRPGATFCGECGFKLLVAQAPAISESAVPARTLVPPPPPPPAVPVAPTVMSAVPVLPPPPPPPSMGVPATVAEAPAVEVPLVARVVNPFITAPPASIPAPAPISIPVAAPVVAPIVAIPDLDLDATRVVDRSRKTPVWRLVLPDGRQTTVEKAVLVGRNAAANASWPEAVLLTVDDSTKSVSKTHAAFDVDAAGLWVTDLHSSNGVCVIQPDGTEVDLEPDQRVQLQPGADVELGSYLIQVEKA